MSHAKIQLAAVLAILIAFAAALAADSAAEKDAEQKQRLAQLQQLVGSWRGVGQPQRGSTQGSWVEEANWAWKFHADGPALVAALPKTKYFQRLELQASDEPGQFVLSAWPPDSSESVEYSGRLENGE